MNIIGSKVGKTDITSIYADGISRSDTKEFTVTAVSLGTISLIEDSEYNGTEIRPLPIITAEVNGDIVELQNGRDYTLRYENNTDASINGVKAKVIATGIGNFTGTAEQTWYINPKVVELEWGERSWTYDGNEHSTTCEVSNLVSGDSCTVTLTGNSITNINESPVTVTATGLSNPNYTLVGASNTSVELTIMAGMFVKISNVWRPVKSVYKKVGDTWSFVRQQDYESTFNTSNMYLKKN